MALFKFQPNDIITATYKTFPSYDFSGSITTGLGRSQPVVIFLSTSVGRTRTFVDLNGNSLTGSYELTGNVQFISSANLTVKEKRALDRLRNTYFSAAMVKPANYDGGSFTSPHIVHIPAAICGSGIKQGSFTLRLAVGANVYNYADDGYGGLFSGSTLAGCLFYEYGIVYCKSTVLGETVNQFTASFSASAQVATNMYLCRVPRGELNFSNNPSYTTFVSSSNRNEVTTVRPKTFITTVGLYDKNYKLVAIAKVSNPVLNEEQTGLLFRLKLHI